MKDKIALIKKELNKSEQNHVIIKEKFGLTLRAVIYPIPENYSFSLGIGFKIENIFH